MRAGFVFPLLAGLVAAALPLNDQSPEELRVRSIGGNELRDGDCKPVVLVYARATLEPFIMGITLGPPLCNGLKEKAPGGAICQGVDYNAAIGDNFLDKGTSEEAIQSGKNMFELAHKQCPDSQIVAGGYSQGAAVMHNAIPTLPDEIKKKIKRVVLFGDTRNKQDKQRIPDYPKDQTLIICAEGDVVCDGEPRVTAPHLSYRDDVDEAVDFLVDGLDG